MYNSRSFRIENQGAAVYLTTPGVEWLRYPVSATLRPVRADSVGRDGTPGGWDSENLYIEGDNLDALKPLQETYLDKVIELESRRRPQSPQYAFPS